MISLTIIQLQKAAKELNETMGLEPAINTESRDRDYLIDMLRESMEIMLEEDEFSDETEEVIANLPDEYDNEESE